MKNNSAFGKALLGMLLFIWQGFEKLQAQTHCEYGVHLGYNLSNVSNNSDLSTKSGYNITGMGEVYWNPSWSVRLKVGYDQKGFGNADKVLPLEYNDGYTSAKMSLNYVTLPLTVNYHFGNAKQFFVNAGGYGAVLSSSVSSKGDYVGNDFKKTDYGVAYGIGMKIPASENTNMFLELEGQNGFAKVGAEYGAYKNFRTSINWGIIVGL